MQQSEIREWISGFIRAIKFLDFALLYQGYWIISCRSLMPLLFVIVFYTITVQVKAPGAEGVDRSEIEKSVLNSKLNLVSKKR